MYGTIYNIPFKSRSNESYEVLLEGLGYGGVSQELTPGPRPFVVDTDESDIYEPIRNSTATLSVVGGGYLQNLYTSNPQGIRVRLLREGSVAWIGYVKPDTFSQEFSKPEFQYDIECVGALQTLKKKEFSSEADTLSFLDLVKEAAGLAGYTSVKVTNAVKTDSGLSVLSNLQISTSNFIDELKKSMNYYDILEEIAKYLGCAFIGFRESLYLMDYQALKAGYHGYTKYEGNFVSEVGESHVSTTQSIGYKGTGATLSRIPGKNKVSVNCSLYETDNILPEFDNEQATIVKEHIFERTYTENEEPVTYKGIIRLYDQPKYDFYKYEWDGTKFVRSIRTDVLSLSTVNAAGSSFSRSTSFKKEDVPISLDLEDAVMVQSSQYYESAFHLLRDAYPVISMQSAQRVVTSPDLYLCLNFSVKFTPHLNFIKPSTESEKEAFEQDSTFPIKAMLKIGDLYYNGTGWVGYETTFNVNLSAKQGNLYYGTYFEVENTNTYELGLGDMRGLVIQCPPAITTGFCDLSICTPQCPATYWTGYAYIKNITLEQAVVDSSNIYGDWVKEGLKNDVIYENEVSDEYVDALDDVELKICTNTDGRICRSSVRSNGQWLSQINSLALGKTDKPEHLIIERLISLFNTPRYSIKVNLSNTIRPYSILTDESLPGVVFAVAGGEEDFAAESYDVKLIEI